MKTKNYPFSGIVGQEKMKKALILNIINPSIGGVLIKGEKGTAKSTAVRGLINLLPDNLLVEDCRYNCKIDSEELCLDCKIKKDKKGILKKMRVVDLPIGATEDRVVGTLDIEYALTHGKKKFEPGILADANNNLLYVDEINLLDDYIVDILLDSAAMNQNIVEREGVSFSHPSNFILIGTMNPEEGDLRPQLLDRFGLTVEVVGEKNIKDRVEVVKRRLDYEEDQYRFALAYHSEDEIISKTIDAAKKRLKNVVIPEKLLALTAEISIELEVDGHRGDITMLKTAKTLAAYHGRDIVTRDDIFEAAELVLPHRMRKHPFDSSGLNKDVLSKWLSEVKNEA